VGVVEEGGLMQGVGVGVGGESGEESGGDGGVGSRRNMGLARGLVVVEGRKCVSVCIQEAALDVRDSAEDGVACSVPVVLARVACARRRALGCV